MLHDLIRHNLSHFDIAKVPQTGALSEQKLLSMKPHEKWWFEKLMDGRLLPDHDGWYQEVMRDALYKDYMKVTGQSGVSPRAIATELGIYLAKLLPRGVPKAVPAKADTDARAAAEAVLVLGFSSATRVPGPLRTDYPRRHELALHQQSGAVDHPLSRSFVQAIGTTGLTLNRAP